jgi:hypothetical protein
MKIRLGGPALISQHNREPANTGMVNQANLEVDYQLATSNQAFENALQVDGVKFQLWRKVNEGRLCSCKHTDDFEVPGNSEFSEFNHGSQDNDVTTVKVRGSWDRQREKPNAYGSELGVDIGKIKPDDASNKQVYKEYPGSDQKEIDAFLNGPLDARLLESGEGTTACGICFGTGYTNGYSLFNGVRYSFDALNVDGISKFSVDRDEHPFIFRTNTDGRGQYVQWKIELPLFTDAIVVLVRNNLVNADQMKVLVQDGNTWVPLTVEWLNSINSESRTILLRAVPNNIKEASLEFSHVEIILQQAEFKYTQIGQLQRTKSSTSVEPVMNTEFPIPPSIGEISESDVVVDYKYKKAWMITDTTDFKTSKNKVVNWNVSVRSLTSFDIPSLLKLSQLPEYEIAYNGLNED